MRNSARPFGFVGGGSSSGGGSTIANPINVTVDVGGISDGDSYPAGTEIETILDDMLQPYIDPVMSGLAVVFSPNDTYFEVGNEVDVVSASWSITNDSAGDPPDDMNLAGDGFDKVVTGTSSIADPGSTSQLTAAGSKTWTLTGKNASGDAITPATYSKQWRFKFAFGASDQANPSDDATATTMFLAMQQSQLLTSKVASFVCTADNDTLTYYTWIIYLASYGALSNIIQNGALPVLTAFTYINSWNVTNSYGVTASYRFYKSNADKAFTSATTLAIS